MLVCSYLGICTFAYASVIASMLTSVMVMVYGWVSQVTVISGWPFQQHQLHDIGDNSHLQYQLHLSFCPFPSASLLGVISTRFPNKLCLLLLAGLTTPALGCHWPLPQQPLQVESLA